MAHVAKCRSDEIGLGDTFACGLELAFGDPGVSRKDLEVDDRGRPSSAAATAEPPEKL